MQKLTDMRYLLVFLFVGVLYTVGHAQFYNNGTFYVGNTGVFYVNSTFTNASGASFRNNGRPISPGT